MSYLNEEFYNFKDLLLKPISDEDLNLKVKQVKEITQCDEESCLLILHDCNYNIEIAINKLLSTDTCNSDWVTSKSKTKKPVKESKQETSNHVPVTVSNENLVSDKYEGEQENQSVLLTGRTFKNFNLAINVPKVPCNFIISASNSYLLDFNTNHVWDGKSIHIKNPSLMPMDFEAANQNKKNLEQRSFSKTSAEESSIFKTHCTTKPPPKAHYSLASAVQMVNKHHHSGLPRFKFGDTKFEELRKSSAVQMLLPIDKTTVAGAAVIPEQEFPAPPSAAHKHHQQQQNQQQELYFTNSKFGDSYPVPQTPINNNSNAVVAGAATANKKEDLMSQAVYVTTRINEVKPPAPVPMTTQSGFDPHKLYFLPNVMMNPVYMALNNTVQGQAMNASQFNMYYEENVDQEDYSGYGPQPHQQVIMNSNPMIQLQNQYQDVNYYDNLGKNNHPGKPW